VNAHQARCPQCREKAGREGPIAEVVVQEIELPAIPTPIRVHSGDMPPFDCTLHPDGSLTAVLGGELRRNAMSFAAMRERNWADAHIELNPPPLIEEPTPEPAVEAVQDALV